jgi:phospholipid/cholesterol/gamma-HCH transport system substrate-binding protein
VTIIAEDHAASPLAASNLEFKAALLLLLLAVLLSASVVYLMYARGAFDDTQRLVLIADDSEGVLVGMDMTFSGFPIGRVGRIELAEDGSVRILIDVPRKDAHWLRASSVFTLTRGLVGGTNLRAYTGIPADPPLLGGAERRVLVGDATAEIPRLVGEMRELVRNLSALTAAESPLAASLGNVQIVTEKLKGPRGALGVLFGNAADARKLMAALDRSNALLARVDALAAKADTHVFGAAGIVPEAHAAVVQLNAALGDARAALKQVNGILDEALAVARNAGAATTDLGVLRAEVEVSLRKVGAMIDEINRRWPFAGERELKLP